jgi:uncharacterized protein
MVNTKTIFDVLEKYNFWDNKNIRLGLIRKEYLEKLLNRLGNKLIKVLTGQRRSGKSYLMRQLIFHLHKKGIPPQNILYINMELSEFGFIKNAQDLNNCIQLFLNKLKPTGKIFLFIDEVQLVDGWEKTINSYSQDYTTDFELFITGSNASILSGELASLLSGRYLTFEILTYSFTEFCELTGDEPGKPAFLSYLTTGALPEIFNLPDMETKMHYVQDLKNTIVLKDIILRHKIKDAALLESLFSFLSQNISNPISIPNLVNYLKNIKVATNFNTLSSYIEYLKQTYVIHEAVRYDLRGKKILSGVRKYYLNDLSFRNLLFPGFESGLGYLLENFVFIELKRNGYEVFTGTDRNKEVDFVAKKLGLTRYFQVCYLLSDEQVINREFGNLENINDNYEKIVVSLDDVSLGIRNGIRHIPAWQTKYFE